MKTHRLSGNQNTDPTPRVDMPGGFSLIELLVVISIIALLIGILLPSLAAARETARQIDCAARLRQLALSVEVYANDEREFYPVRGVNWPTALHRYFQTVDLLVCPSDMPEYRDPALLPDPDVPNNAKRSYFINGFNDVYDVTNDGTLSYDNPPGGWAMSRKLMVQPSDVILFGEKKTTSLHYFMDLNEGASGNDFTELEQARHGGGSGTSNGIGASNYAFADGSTRTFAFPEAIQPVNYWAIVPAYRDTSAYVPSY